MTLPTLPGITGRAVADWLTGRFDAMGVTGVKIVGSGSGYLADGRLLDSPDRLVIVTRTPGTGLAFEGIFDGVGFQARSRGLQGDAGGDDAEWIALAVDSALLDAKQPVVMDGHDVPRIDRIGGSPAYYTRDSAGRTHFTCNYLIFASR